MRAFVLPTLLVLGLATFPIVAWIVDEPYFLDTISRLIIFAIAAASLNLITGYGGMVSLGQAMFLGIGAYVVGIMAHHGWTNGFLQVAVTLAVSALAAAFVGSIALRAHGIFFIMITLALAQIFYYLSLSSGRYGGEEGLVVIERSQFFSWMDVYSVYQFYAICAAALLICLYVQWRIIKSPFGHVLISCRENEKRARAIGYNTFFYKLMAIVISGMMCGIAGFLLANLSNFATPSYAYWYRSGELLIMVLLGGMGTLIGPVLGAFAFLSLEHWVASHTRYWGLVVGPLLIIVVLSSRGGIMGLIDALAARVRGQRS